MRVDEIGYGFVILAVRERGMIAVSCSVNRDGKVIDRAMKMAGDDASARLIARQYMASWTQKFFNDNAPLLDRPPLLFVQRGH